jgi:hypothetical protein
VYYDYVNCLAVEFKILKNDYLFTIIIILTQLFNSALSAIIAKIIAKITSTIAQCKIVLVG